MIIRNFASDSSHPPKEIHGILKLKAVRPGEGMAGNDLSYNYAFTIPPIAINCLDYLTISVEGELGQPNPYVMHSYASTSLGVTLVGERPPFSAHQAIRSMRFKLKLAANELAFLSIIVIDTFKTPGQSYDLICCDPQVANDAKT